MKRLMVTSIIIVLLSTSCYAKTQKEYVDSLTYIDNQLAILINSIVTNCYNNLSDIEKDLTFIESQINTIYYNIDTDYKPAKEKDILADKEFLLNIKNINSNYDLATISIRRYYKSKTSNGFINVMNYYSTGNLRLIYIKNSIEDRLSS